MKERKRKVNQTHSEPYVFPELLEKRLTQIPNYPLTFVEAPSGFGKTTAIKEYLKNNLSAKNARKKWYTCLGEPPSNAWFGICQLFEKIDSDTSWKLSKLFPLTKESIPEIAALMRECRCEDKTFLVIDNYQLFENETPYEIVNALSVHAAEKLHIIVITQPFFSYNENVYNASIHKLDKRDFLFDLDSTARLCRRLSGMRLSDEELEKVQGFSEGWVSAIRLQVENFRKTGSFTSADSMDELIKTAIWNRVSDEGRCFLISLSLLEGFTKKQAAIMGDWPALPKSLEHMLESNFFIPYIVDKGVHSMHSLLRDFLLKHLDGQPSGFIETMNRRAASACRAVFDYFQAARFYMKVKDFNAILSMPFTPRYLNEQEENEVTSFLELFMEVCPDNTLCEYPFTMLAFAFQFMKSGKRSLFSRILRLLKYLCSSLQSQILSEAELSRVKGEFAILMSFTTFNDIVKMNVYHKEALDYFNSENGSPSTVILGKTPWTFGITSVLSLFWSGIGELDRECALMDDCLPIYSRIANGHGTGADSVFRAEALLMRGDDTEAEAACYKAIYQAHGENQMGICLCAELVLARIAILRGDGSAYAAIRDRITKEAEEPRQRSISRMGELCLASLDMMLGDTQDLPEWLRDVSCIRQIFYAQGHSHVLMLHGLMLLLEGRRVELYGLTDPLLNMAREMNYLLPQVYHHIYLAIAKKNDGSSQALEHLNDALNLALRDRIYLPFAEFGVTLLPLLELLNNNKNSKVNFKAKEIKTVIDLCKRWTFGALSILQHNIKTKTLLTPREREIALLAKEWLSSREIASHLYISENTVKSALKNIYNKLEIHSRIDLVKKDF